MNHSKEMMQIFKTAKLMGGKAMFVGGAVRNFILNGVPLESGDVDIAINIPVELVAQKFREIGANVITKYATNIVVLNGKVFEITSTRKDENCDGRYATMVFTSSFEEDAKRRDFTINALYMDEKDEIFDFHGGIEDLKQRKVRFIGNPEFRIEEDALRIWRFFRFSCLYAKELDEEGFKACILKKNNLAKLSKERITAEMFKMLEGEEEKLKFILSKMIKSRILKAEEWNLKHELPLNAFNRLAVMNKGDFCQEFIYTSKQKKMLNLYKRVRNLLKQKNEVYKLFYILPKEDFEFIKIVAQSLKEMTDFSIPPILPFSKKEIMQEGFRGEEISKEFERRLEEFCLKITDL
jgi:tRNA nucleotidyltransferase/poly(A) polymerase